MRNLFGLSIVLTSIAQVAMQTGNQITITLGCTTIDTTLEPFGAPVGMPCVFPFTHLGVSYSQCTVGERSEPWCATANWHSGDIASSWGYCNTTACSVSNERPTVDTTDLDISSTEEDDEGLSTLVVAALMVAGLFAFCAMFVVLWRTLVDTNDKLRRSSTYSISETAYEVEEESGARALMTPPEVAGFHTQFENELGSWDYDFEYLNRELSSDEPYSETSLSISAVSPMHDFRTLIDDGYEMPVVHSRRSRDSKPSPQAQRIVADRKIESEKQDCPRDPAKSTSSPGQSKDTGASAISDAIEYQLFDKEPVPGKRNTENGSRLLELVHSTSGGTSPQADLIAERSKLLELRRSILGHNTTSKSASGAASKLEPRMGAIEVESAAMNAVLLRADQELAALKEQLRERQVNVAIV